MKAVLSIAFLFFLASPILAQESSVVVEPNFMGSSPTAISLPLPKYNQKDVTMNGIVSVSVTVDESGSVVLTDDGDGPYPICKNVTDPRVLSLRAAAVEAAKNAKFSPAVVDSKPTTVTGRINYNFKSDDTGKMAGQSIIGSKQEMRLDRMTTIGKPETDLGGVLNGKAESLGKPNYPNAAKAVRAGGSVDVQVLILEGGEVYWAKAVSGHPLLRRSSEIAACSTRFSPTLLEGNPVKVSGVITYNFIP